ncbi:hypothetical protein ACPCIZ_22755 [Streptomyces cellulosae]|uniref:hypothetical protein n=1 Tax=Streptomyces albogriseolus TaxID=1887 RepID=UPI003CF6B5DA
MEQLRYLGTDATTGKSAYALPAPGGALERMADTTALETAAVVTALVGEVLDAGKATDAELAAFVPMLLAALRELTDVTARLLDAESV